MPMIRPALGPLCAFPTWPPTWAISVLVDGPVDGLVDGLVEVDGSGVPTEAAPISVLATADFGAPVLGGTVEFTSAPPAGLLVETGGAAV